MCLLFETIKVMNGKVYHLSYHQHRVNKYSNVNLLFYIRSCVDIPIAEGVFKLRITYSKSSIYTHTIEPYTPKRVESLKIVIDDNIDYHLKFNDRTCLNTLLEQKGECDDILIIKHGMVTDISFANIIFFNGKQWVTSDTPLLEGCCRARLIKHNIITSQRITIDDLKLFSKFKIINSLLIPYISSKI